MLWLLIACGEDTDKNEDSGVEFAFETEDVLLWEEETTGF